MVWKRRSTKDTEVSEEGEEVEVQEDEEVVTVPQDVEVPSSDKRISVKDRIKDLEEGGADKEKDDEDNDDLECKPTEDDDDDASATSGLSLTSILHRKELLARLTETLETMPRELRDEAVDRFEREAVDAQERALYVRPLLMHSYHLPGYNWRQDWWQYITNNHPVFGICFHHRHHPLGVKVRIASLIGSVLFGLAVTNIIYLAFVFTEYDPEQEYFSVTTNITKTGWQDDFDQTVSSISVTSGNIALWTVGALLHGFYDNCIWALAACSCLVQEGSRRRMQQERLQRYRSSGAFLVNIATIGVVALATFGCMLRAAITADEEGSTEIVSSHELVHGELQKIEQNRGVDFQDYEFVVSYLVELLLNYLVYYPLVGTVLFSGVLNCCGRLNVQFPVLGGRPFELKQLERSDSDLDESDLEEGIEVEWNDEEGENKEKIKDNNKQKEEEDSESCTGSADTGEEDKEEGGDAKK